MIPIPVTGDEILLTNMHRFRGEGTEIWVVFGEEFEVELICWDATPLASNSQGRKI